MESHVLTLATAHMRSCSATQCYTVLLSPGVGLSPLGPVGRNPLRAHTNISCSRAVRRMVPFSLPRPFRPFAAVGFGGASERSEMMYAIVVCMCVMCACVCVQCACVWCVQLSHLFLLPPLHLSHPPHSPPPAHTFLQSV